MGTDSIGLLELQSRLKSRVECAFPDHLWVRAEISSIKARPGGHCYLDLSESDAQGNLVAKASAIIWSRKYRIIAPYFQKVTGMPLQEGLTVLFRVRVNYSELYGLSLVADDVDPEITLGKQEMIRQQTIERLKEEGVFDLQRGLELPVLPYKIAVISASDAAGYRDFMRHLHENEYGFQFSTQLFPALMQGKDAPESIVAAMDAVLDSGEGWDVVVIMRGGGSKLDLSCFDDYALAANIAQYPIPVLTALGHDQDYHVSDMVACVHVKTPTALADFFLSIYEDEDAMLQSFSSRLRYAFANKIALMESRLSNYETRIRAADPRNILSKGFVLALDGEGVVVKKAEGLKAGDEFRVMFADGEVVGHVDGVKLLK